MRNEAAHMRRERVGAVRCAEPKQRRQAFVNQQGERRACQESGHQGREWGQPTEQGIDGSPTRAQSVVEDQPCLLRLCVSELETEESDRLSGSDFVGRRLSAPGPLGFRSASGSSSYSFIDTGSITFVPT